MWTFKEVNKTWILQQQKNAFYSFIFIHKKFILVYYKLETVAGLTTPFTNYVELWKREKNNINLNWSLQARNSLSSLLHIFNVLTAHWLVNVFLIFPFEAQTGRIYFKRNLIKLKVSSLKLSNITCGHEIVWQELLEEGDLSHKTDNKNSTENWKRAQFNQSPISTQIYSSHIVWHTHILKLIFFRSF